MVAVDIVHTAAVEEIAVAGVERMCVMLAVCYEWVWMWMLLTSSPVSFVLFSVSAVL